MQPQRKYSLPPSNKVYVIDGASYGVDDGLVDAIRDSIGRRLASKTLEIPRLPQVAGRILELSGNPNSSMDDVVEAITTDPILATRFLTIANSATYAGGARIEDLKGALLRLGTKIVSDTVFAETIRMKIFSARAYREILEHSWKLSLGTAIACEALSRATGLERSSAFLMGLLHDTGTPVLVTAIGEYEKQNRGQALGPEVVEILITQIHEEVGAHVLTEWGLSPAIVAAAGAHHHYRGAEKSTPACSLVHAGNLVCRHLGIGLEQSSVAFNIERVFVDLHIGDADKIAPILETVERDFNALMAGMHAA
jgi:HD-like signal output (HDOD) protein